MLLCKQCYTDSQNLGSAVLYHLVLYSFKENMAIQAMIILWGDFRQYHQEQKVEMFWRIVFSLVDAWWRVSPAGGKFPSNGLCGQWGKGAVCCWHCHIKHKFILHLSKRGKWQGWPDVSLRQLPPVLNGSSSSAVPWRESTVAMLVLWGLCVWPWLLACTRKSDTASISSTGAHFKMPNKERMCLLLLCGLGSVGKTNSCAPFCVSPHPAQHLHRKK